MQPDPVDRILRDDARPFVDKLDDQLRTLAGDRRTYALYVRPRRGRRLAALLAIAAPVAAILILAL